MSRNTIKKTENLTLRRIDPVLMYRRYMSGEFRNVKIPESKITISTAFVNLNNKIGSDQNSESYRFNDKTNSSQVIVTTNHEQYSYAKEHNGSNDTNINQLPKAFCRWCRREIRGRPIGVPISMEINKRTNVAVFNVEDTHDSFGCALATLKRTYSCNKMYKDPLYIDAEQLLYCMYYRMHPKKEGTQIKEANDWRLLRCNGGPLSDSEYDSDRYDYLRTPNVIVVPLKRQYIKLSIAKKKN